MPDAYCTVRWPPRGPRESGRFQSTRRRRPRAQPVTLVAGDFEGDAQRVSTTAEQLVRAVRPGDRLLLDDGRLQVEVEEASGSEIGTRVLEGGPLAENKGITAPNVTLPSDTMTDKDVTDLALGVELGVDLVAVSFVQSPEDLERVRDALRVHGRTVPLIAKIERPQAVDALDDVLEASDGAMVARGDLGLELPFERVPRVQKQITRRARQLGPCLRKSLVLWRSCWYAAGHAENTPPQTADAAGRRTPNLGGMDAPPEAGAASGAALADRVGRCGRSDEPSGRRAAGRVERLRL